MKTKIKICLIIIFMGIIGFMPNTVIADTTGTYNDELKYTINDTTNTVTITGTMNKEINAIIIPDKIEGCSVTSIGLSAFSGCTKLESIEIADSVNYIGAYAFHGCESLKNIQIPESVKEIAEWLFVDCKNLINVKIPNNVTSIGENAFYGCTKLESIEIPNSVTDIGAFAFWYCEDLKDVQLSSNLKEIKEYTFDGCKSLTSISIPNNVTSIGNLAFYECTSLENVVIPESTRAIGDSAFYNCENLLNVIINGGLNNIGDYAFSYCFNLKNIIMPNTITKIGKNAFDYCYNLKVVVDKNSYAEEYAKNNLLEYSYSKGNLLYEIDEEDNTASITGVIDKSITSIRIPEKIEGYNVTNIRYNAFSDCKNIESIYIPENIESASGAFADSVIESITFEEGITKIPDGLFSDCKYLKEIIIPNSITEIGSGAFSGCENLTDVVLSNSLKIIGDYAFDSCNHLETLIIPDTVAQVGERTFSNCVNLVLTINNNTYMENYAEENFVSYNDRQFNTGIEGEFGLEIYNSNREPMSYYPPESGDTAFIFNLAKDYTNCEYELTLFDNYGSTIETELGTFSYKEKRTEKWINEDTEKEYEDTYYIYTAPVDKSKMKLNNGIWMKIIATNEETKKNDILYGFVQFYYFDLKETTNLSINGEYIIKDGKYVVDYTAIGNGEVEENGWFAVYKEDDNALDITGKNVVVRYSDMGENFKVNLLYDSTAEIIEEKVKTDIKNCTINDILDKEFTGKEIKADIELKNGDTTLKENTDYTVNYSDNTNVGTVAVTIEGIGDYTGQVEKTFKILAKDISKLDFSKVEAQTYTGTEIKPTITIKYGDVILENKIDYEVSYENNKNVGKATILIKGMGNYTGIQNIKFEIKETRVDKIEINKCTVSKIYDKTYTGRTITANVVLKNGNTILKEGIDYTVTYKNNKYTGKATVTITGKGNYTGSISKTFNIVPAKASISSVKNVSRKSAKVTWKKDTQATGYEIYMSTAKADKTYMKTTSKLTLRKSTSTSSKSLLKIPKGAKVKVLKKNVKKSRGYTWYKVSYKGKTGYVASKYLETIYNEGKYSKIKTITSNKTTSYTKTKLSKGKKYTFKIRSYKTIDGKKYYGSYSNVKWVTIKK